MKTIEYQKVCIMVQATSSIFQFLEAQSRITKNFRRKIIIQVVSVFDIHSKVREYLVEFLLGPQHKKNLRKSNLNESSPNESSVKNFCEDINHPGMIDIGDPSI